MALLDHQREFVDFALAHDVLSFGDFTLKSGRRSPYFFNAGRFDSGARLAALGGFYADTITTSGIGFDQLFGPAYKGIPLVSTTAVALHARHGLDVPWSFDRKEPKDHGEGGLIVGRPLAGRVLLVDDVITAGTAVRGAVQIIRDAGAELAGIVVAIDRQERGQGELSAVGEVQRDLGCPVLAVVTLDQVVEHLRETGQHTEHLGALVAYRAEYGVSSSIS